MMKRTLMIGAALLLTACSAPAPRAHADDFAITVNRTAKIGTWTTEITFTLENKSATDFAHVGVNCALLDESGAPVVVGVGVVANVGANSKTFGSATAFMEQPHPWKTVSCRTTDAIRK